MKTVLFIRHAKSSWDAAAANDFDRPLNDRGNKDAPMMAKRLLEKDLKIDAFVTSPAVRALTTAKYFLQAYKAKKEALVEVPELYHAGIPVFNEVIENLGDSIANVAIFSHNPGITQMVNALEVATVDNMPTCGVFGIKLDAKHWKDFKTADRQFLIFDYPKLG